MTSPALLDRLQLEVEVAHLSQSTSSRWVVELGLSGLRAYVTLTPTGYPVDTYCLRLEFGSGISEGPPSVLFCDPQTRVESNPQDWPKGFDNYFKPPPQNGSGWICMPWTKEGRQHHAEWNSFGWRPTRVIWRVTTAVQDVLDKPDAYTGRLTK
jgi:hypothetical protein